MTEGSGKRREDSLLACVIRYEGNQNNHLHKEELWGTWCGNSGQKVTVWKRSRTGFVSCGVLEGKWYPW